MDSTGNKYNKIAFFSLIIYCAWTTLDGTGRLIDFGFISLRMILFALACLMTLPPLASSFRRTMLNPCVIAAIAFGIVMVIWAYIGFANGNNPAYIREDLTSVMAFALMPGFIATVNDEKKLNTVVNVLFFCTVVIAIVMTVAYCLCPLISEKQLSLMNSSLRGVISNAGITEHQVYFRTHIFMIPGVMIGVLKSRDASVKKKVLLAVADGLMVFALLVAMERSSWLGFAVSLIIVLVLRPREITHYLKSGLSALLVLAVLVGIASATRGELALVPDVFGKIGKTSVGVGYAYEDYVALAEVVDDSNAPVEGSSFAIAEDFSNPEVRVSKKQVMKVIGADNWRKLTMERHKYYISKYWLGGAGLGFDFNITQEVDTDKTDYVYLDFLVRLGCLGFLVFLAAFFMPAIRFLMTDGHMLLTAYLFASYIGIAVTSYFEPYMNNPMIIMLTCLLAAATTIDREQNDQ